MEEEVEALSSVFCNPGELEVVGNEVRVKLTAQNAEIFFIMPPNYPDEPPTVSVRCPSISRHYSENITRILNEKSSEYKGQNCIWELCQEAQALLNEDNPIPSEPENTSRFIRVFIAFDHMRDRKTYLANLKTFSSQTKTRVTILFYEKHIRGVIEGEEEGVKAWSMSYTKRLQISVETACFMDFGVLLSVFQRFLKLLRTVCVDVDSRGKPCREKMMTVLSEEEAIASTESGFKSVTIETFKNLTECAEKRNWNFQSLQLSYSGSA